MPRIRTSRIVLLDAGSEEYILGDTDGNGDVDVVDAAWLQRYVALMDVSIIEETVMHGDGDPSVVDATFILRYCVSIATPYAIGESVEQQNISDGCYILVSAEREPSSTSGVLLSTAKSRLTPNSGKSAFKMDRKWLVTQKSTAQAKRNR